MTQANLLPGANICVFDLEIKKPIGQDGVSWSSFDRMGISVGCIFDYRTMDYTVYLDDNIKHMVDRLNAADLITGFNIEKFDIPLIRATEGLGFLKPDADLPIYDILIYSRMAVGWSPGARDWPKGLNLDEHLRGTFGVENMKTANGAEAPIMYQEKRFGELISYCIADVKREAMLFKHIWKNGYVTTATHGQRNVQRPPGAL